MHLCAQGTEKAKTARRGLSYSLSVPQHCGRPTGVGISLRMCFGGEWDGKRRQPVRSVMLPEIPRNCTMREVKMRLIRDFGLMSKYCVIYRGKLVQEYATCADLGLKGGEALFLQRYD